MVCILFFVATYIGSGCLPGAKAVPVVGPQSNEVKRGFCQCLQRPHAPLRTCKVFRCSVCCTHGACNCKVVGLEIVIVDESVRVFPPSANKRKCTPTIPRESVGLLAYNGGPHLVKQFSPEPCVRQNQTEAMVASVAKRLLRKRTTINDQPACKACQNRQAHSRAFQQTTAEGQF